MRLFLTCLFALLLTGCADELLSVNSEESEPIVSSSTLCPAFFQGSYATIVLNGTRAPYQVSDLKLFGHVDGTGTANLSTGERIELELVGINCGEAEITIYSVEGGKRSLFATAYGESSLNTLQLTMYIRHAEGIPYVNHTQVFQLNQTTS